MEITKKSIIGEVVAEDYRYASVFKSYCVDFCCNGNRTIYEASQQQQINADEVVQALNKVSDISEKGADNFDAQSWDLDLLADYIEKKHHRYVATKIPEITMYLQKIAEVHGARHPELLEISELFSNSAQELLAHMKKEEHILFPYIRQQMEVKNTAVVTQKPGFGTIQNPIQVMMHEHDTEGERFRKIAKLSDNYSPPTDACSTYKVAFSLLKEFEEDLHRHIHLENNILFPKAIKLEQRLAHA